MVMVSYNNACSQDKYNGAAAKAVETMKKI